MIEQARVLGKWQAIVNVDMESWKLDNCWEETLNFGKMSARASACFF